MAFGYGVAFERYSSFLWCVGGLFLAGRCLGGGGGMACCELSQYGSVFQWCVASARTAAHTSIYNIRHPAHLWPLTPPTLFLS